MTSSGGRPATGWVGVVLALLVVAAAGYGRVLDAPFVFDDVRNVVENPAVRWERIGWEEVRRAVLESPTPRPVSNLTFGLHHVLGGSEAAFRLTNVAIHVANGLWIHALALLTYRRASRLPGGDPRLARPAVAAALAALAAGLFVAHPVQTQAVTYAVQRMTSLSTFFVLAAAWLWLRGGEPEAARARWRIAALASFLLGLGAKEIAIALPFALWLHTATFERDWEPRWCARTLPPLVLAAGVGLVAGLAATDALADYASQPFGLAERLWSAPRVFWLYVSLVALPLPGRQNLLHDLAASSAWNEPPTTALALVAFAGACAAAFALRRRARFATFGFAWFALHLALESTVLPLALVFEHRLYLPLAGVALSLPPLLLRAAGLRATLGAGVVVVVALTAATAVRNEVWRDPVTLWRDAVAKSPESAQAHDELGLALLHAGRRDEAEAALARAVQLAPDDPEPWTHLGLALARRGAFDEARRAYRTALGIDPGYARAWHALGLRALDEGDAAEAVAHLERAVALSPRDAPLRADLGIALQRAGRAGDARAAWDAALAIDPRLAVAHAQLGELALRASREADALRHLEVAVREAPTRASVNNLAWLLATSGDPAIRDPERALALAGELASEGGDDDPSLLDTLAAAQAAAGRPDEAARTASRAADLADARGRDALAARIRARAARYAERASAEAVR